MHPPLFTFGSVSCIYSHINRSLISLIPTMQFLITCGVEGGGVEKPGRFYPVSDMFIRHASILRYMCSIWKNKRKLHFVTWDKLWLVDNLFVVCLPTDSGSTPTTPTTPRGDECRDGAKCITGMLYSFGWYKCTRHAGTCTLADILTWWPHNYAIYSHS